MKLLIDSCAPAAVVRRLRQAGHDVRAVGENPPDPGDQAVLAMARFEGRVIVTVDCDFGTLVFRDGLPRTGVLRLKQRSSAVMAERSEEAVRLHQGDLEGGAFVTETETGFRIRKA